MDEKRKRCALSVDVKQKIIICVQDNPLKKRTEIAQDFGISPSTLSTIIKNKDKFEEGSGLAPNIKKLKSAEFKDLEECVLKWLRQCRDKNVPVGGPILQEKALQFALGLGYDNFRASNGWLQNFKKKKEQTYF